MYHSGFAHTDNIRYDETLWNIFPTNSKAYFYREDEDYCSHNYSLDNYKYSLGIYAKSISSAYFQRTFSTTVNTNYVVNVMMKSSFVTNANKPFTTLPGFINVIVGSETISSIETVGISDEWTEISLGFNSRNNTQVTIRIGANFSEALNYETVLFNGIRIDKLKTTKLLFLAYNSVSYTGDDGFNYSGSFTNNFSSKLLTVKTQFENAFRLVSNGKVIPEITTQYVNRLNYLTITDTNYGPELKDIVRNGEDITGYDCVLLFTPLSGEKNGRSYIYGVYTGIYDSNSYTSYRYDKLLDRYDFLFNGVGYIYFSASFLEGFNVNTLNNMDGYLHEFIHYLQDCASHLDKKIRKSYPAIDDLDRFNRNEYMENVSFVRENTTYINYELFYEHLRDNNYYDYLFTDFINLGQTYKMKYRWYYDVLNSQVQNCYSSSGVWGMLSNWVEIGCEQITYLLSSNHGIKPGVYEIKNVYSSLFLDATLNASNAPTQQNHSYMDNQYWEFKSCNDGSFEIIPFSCYTSRLTASSNSTVTLTSSNNTNSQRWMVKVISSNYYIYSKLYPSVKLQLSSQSSSGGIGIKLGSSTSNSARWNIRNVNEVSDSLVSICSQFSEKCISAVSNGDYDITQNLYTADLTQIWKIKSCNDGYIQLIPLSDMNTCLTVISSSNIGLRQNTESNSQKWIVSKLLNNNYRITPKSYPLKCLDVRGPLIEDGTPIQLWNYQDSSNEMKWSISCIHNEGNVLARLRSCFSTFNYLKHNDDITIGHDVVQHSRTPESAYSGWSYFDSNYEYSSHFMWEFSLQPDGFYKISPLSNHRKYLTASDTSNNPAELSLQSDYKDDSQKWLMIRLNDGKYRISPVNNITKAIVLFGPIVTDNAFIQLWTYNSTSEIKWFLEKIQFNFNGISYRIKSKMDGHRCIDGRINDDSAPIESQRDDILSIYSSNDNQNQKWKICMKNGYYVIVSLESPEYSVAGIVSSKAGSDSVRKKNRDYSDEQQWIIENRNGKYCIIPKNNPDKCVCIYGPFNRDGELLHLFTYNNNNDLNWEIVED